MRLASLLDISRKWMKQWGHGYRDSPKKRMFCGDKWSNEVWRRRFWLKFGWWNEKSFYAHGIGYRKPIMSNLYQFHPVVHYKVKNESKFLFWHNVWCRDQHLKFGFLGPFRMLPLTEATVQEVMTWSGNQNQ